MKKLFKILFFLVLLFAASFILLRQLYKRDVTKPEPTYWQGALQYRLNFRDVGESLNQCLGRNQFAFNQMYRSNKNFSGWSCDKIQNPSQIYSLNYDPSIDQKFYCTDSKGKKQFGIAYNTDFAIVGLSDLTNWENENYKNSVCLFIENSLSNLAQKNSFLYHCDIGRDRTGDFTAIITYMLLEERNLNSLEMIDALECDYEKTSAIRNWQIGHIKTFLEYMENHGGMKAFVQSKCNISDNLILQASKNFIH